MAGRTPRDTLYSMGVVDTEGGATITVPEMPAGRYFSVYLVDNDHYVPEVIYEPGTQKLPEDTKYLGVGVRIRLMKADDPKEGCGDVPNRVDRASGKPLS